MHPPSRDSRAALAAQATLTAMTALARPAILAAALTLAACSGQKEPAHKLIADIDATVMAASSEAAKYVPDELLEVQTKLGALKASFDKQDYAAVVADGPAVLGTAQTLATAAATRKDEVLKDLNDQWTTLAGAVPGRIIAIQNRLAFLGRKTNHKFSAGVDLDAAGAGASAAQSLWSKAQAAFAAGNLQEAVMAAKSVQAQVDNLAATLKLDPAPAA